MKLVKRILVILLIVIVTLPIASYIGIVITNNVIANNIEKDLIAYELPPNTKLVDSVSVAAKLTGSGNGMQYMGAVLVESILSEEELKEHYSSSFDYIEVSQQETPKLDFIQSVYFNADIESEDKTYYSIICWDDNRREMFGDLLCELLDFDIRGH
ncbi:MAG: hypothetical protein IJD71_05220 [Clostridia bacterium]|nr:hypothetical protein [Clostridia bacterium]